MSAWPEALEIALASGDATCDVLLQAESPAPARPRANISGTIFFTAASAICSTFATSPFFSGSR